MAKLGVMFSALIKTSFIILNIIYVNPIVLRDKHSDTQERDVSESGIEMYQREDRTSILIDRGEMYPRGE